MERKDKKEWYSKEVEMLPQRFGDFLFSVSALARIQPTINEKGPFSRFEIARRDLLPVVFGLLVGIIIGIIFAILGIGAEIMRPKM